MTNEISKIEFIVHRFWESLNEALHQHAFPKRPRTTIYYFPRGCCEIASSMLAQYLLENGISTFLVRGDYGDQPHAWLETESEWIVDITSGQLKQMPEFNKYNLSEYYVGPHIPFYDLFSDYYEKYEFNGLECESEDYKRKIYPLYETLLRYLDEDLS